MRKLDKRERGLLFVLACAGIALWVVLGGTHSGSERSGRDTRDALEDPGRPPVVRLELLGADAEVFDAQGRNLFAYYTPREQLRQPRGVRSLPDPPRPPVSQEDPKVVRKPDPEPTPPQPTFDYIGLLGPKDDLIAVFNREAGVFVAQVGDVIDDTFQLLDFRYEGVVLGFVGKQWSGGTVTLKRPTG